jgi:two-component system chemotaxis response regulator CheB
MIRAIVIDDSAMMREMLARQLPRDGDIEVVATAEDPLEARSLIKELNPDVVTLDNEMPNMNGLQFLEKLMRLRPLPVVMVSTLTHRGASETLLALELGAVDFVEKPKTAAPDGLAAFGDVLRKKVRSAAGATVKGRDEKAEFGAVPAFQAPAGTLIAIGASTGGVEAIRAVLGRLPPSSPPIVIAQHMPAGFTARFAERLTDVTALTVAEAQDRQVLKPGHAYVAPGDFHLRIERSSGELKCRITQDELASGHRPSVDVLFESVARTLGPMAVGAILTGMGRDGARGLRLMREAGAFTLGQSEGSALVYGMPRVAFEEGAVMEQAPVEAIAGKLAHALQRIRGTS